VCWAVASAPGERAGEARASAEDLLRGACSIDVVLGEFEDGYLPHDGRQVKAWVHGVAERTDPDVVLTHQRGDLHQDHRFLAELALNAFRNHLLLGFEIPKYDGDLGAPNVFVPVDRETVQRKIDALRRHFQTQWGKPWFDDDVFLGLLRLRGMECRAPSGLAEAFYCAKLVTGPA
jgi:LmbE family N-acetylglucosaminyl deacetylase